MKSVFTSIIKLCLCVVVTLAYLNMAHADGDTLSPGIETCNGSYAFGLGRSGTCDSTAECETQRNCPDAASGCGFHATYKCQTEDDFDCDSENDDSEYGIAGKDPTVPAIAQHNHDDDFLFDNCDPDDDNDGLLDTQEDTNGNNTVDWGETDPLIADTDYDGVNDKLDECPAGQKGWTSNDTNDKDADGCLDSNKEEKCIDKDGDGYGVDKISGCPGAPSGPSTATTIPDNCPDVANPDQKYGGDCLPGPKPPTGLQ